MRFNELISKKIQPFIFKGIIFIGGPGSGKSYYANFIARRYGLRKVDVDELYRLNAAKGLPVEPKPDGRRYSQRDRILQRTLTKRFGFVYDGTGRDEEYLLNLMQSIENNGYDIAVVHVACDIEEAVRRNSQRDRTVDEDFLRLAHKSLQALIPRYREAFGRRLLELDNTDLADTSKNLSQLTAFVERFRKSPIMHPKALDWLDAMADTSIEKIPS